MRNTVDFDSIGQPLRYRHNVEARSKHGEPVFELAQTSEFGCNARSVHFYSVASRSKSKDLWWVGLPAITERRSPANLAAYLRPAPKRRRIKFRLLRRQLGFITFNGSLYEGCIGVTPRNVLSLHSELIKPADV